jgi:hypothetical protein
VDYLLKESLRLLVQSTNVFLNLVKACFICCECGAEIPLVRDLVEMGYRIENSALQHKRGEKDKVKAEENFNHLQDFLAIQFFKTVLRQ